MASNQGVRLLELPPHLLYRIVQLVQVNLPLDRLYQDRRQAAVLRLHQDLVALCLTCKHLLQYGRISLYRRLILEDGSELTKRAPQSNEQSRLLLRSLQENPRLLRLIEGLSFYCHRFVLSANSALHDARSSLWQIRDLFNRHKAASLLEKPHVVLNDSLTFSQLHLACNRPLVHNFELGPAMSMHLKTLFLDLHLQSDASYTYVVDIFGKVGRRLESLCIRVLGTRADAADDIIYTRKDDMSIIRFPRLRHLKLMLARRRLCESILRTILQDVITASLTQLTQIRLWNYIVDASLKKLFRQHGKSVRELSLYPHDLSAKALMDLLSPQMTFSGYEPSTGEGLLELCPQLDCLTINLPDANILQLLASKIRVLRLDLRRRETWADTELSLAGLACATTLMKVYVFGFARSNNPAKFRDKLRDAMADFGWRCTGLSVDLDELRFIRDLQAGKQLRQS